MTDSLTTATQPASGVVANYIASIPVDVYGLARDLGLRVVTDPSLPKTISGRLSRDSSSAGGYRVTLNGNDGERRRRFTLAHEIGHFVLHRDLIRDGVTDDDMYRSVGLADDIERQANRFAAQVLIPAERLRSMYRDQKALAPLARAFDVSEAAIRVRLKELRLAP